MEERKKVSIVLMLVGLLVMVLGMAYSQSFIIQFISFIFGLALLIFGTFINTPLGDRLTSEMHSDIEEEGFT